MAKAEDRERERLTAIARPADLLTRRGRRILGRVCLLGVALGAMLFALADLAAPEWLAVAVSVVFAGLILLQIAPSLLGVVAGKAAPTAQPPAAGSAGEPSEPPRGPASP